MILNAEGEPYRRMTLLELAQGSRPSLLPVIGALSKKNSILRSTSKILDQFGRPIWRDDEFMWP